METVKNIVLGLLIGVVICMGFEIYSLKQANQESDRVVQEAYKDDPMIAFERFFDIVLEFEAKKKAQDKEFENRIYEPEAGN